MIMMMTSLFVLDNWEIIEGIFMSMYSTQATKNWHGV